MKTTTAPPDDDNGSTSIENAAAINQVSATKSSDLGILGIGIAVGVAICLPIAMFSRAYLQGTTDAVVSSILAGLIGSALLSIFAVVFRAKLLAFFFGDVKATWESAGRSLSSAISAWPDKPDAIRAAIDFGRESGAIVSWTLARRSFVTLLIGLIGALIAAIGTVVLLEQTKAIEEQNKKLDLQTELLQRQNTIMANEGIWEDFWKAHFSNGQEQLAAVKSLVQKNSKLSGLKIVGDLAPEPSTPMFVWSNSRKTLDLSPQRPPNAALFKLLTDEYLRGVENSFLEGIVAQQDEKSVKNEYYRSRASVADCSECEFVTSEATIRSPLTDRQSTPTCYACRFYGTVLSQEYESVRLEKSFFQDVVIRAESSRIEIVDSHASRLTVVCDYPGCGLRLIDTRVDELTILVKWQENVEEVAQSLLKNLTENSVRNVKIMSKSQNSDHRYEFDEKATILASSILAEEKNTDK